MVSRGSEREAWAPGREGPLPGGRGDADLFVYLLAMFTFYSSKMNFDLLRDTEQAYKRAEQFHPPCQSHFQLYPVYRAGNKLYV